MQDNSSNDRLIRNEQLIRNKNLMVEKTIKKYFRGGDKITGAPLEFECECSDLDCNVRIKMSIDRYEKLHRRKDQFIVAPGHVEGEIEKVVDRQDDFMVVQKFALKS